MKPDLDQSMQVFQLFSRYRRSNLKHHEEKRIEIMHDFGVTVKDANCKMEASPNSRCTSHRYRRESLTTRCVRDE